MIEYSVQGSVLMVGLDRPGKSNALPTAAADQLLQAFTSINPEVSAAVLYGNGKNFCSGLDINDFAGNTALEGFDLFRRWQKVFDQIQFGEVPVIAAISGAAIGAGLEIATACHIRVVDDSAWFSLPEAQNGLYVGLGGSVRLPKIIGQSRMMDMMLTGRVIDAQESVAFGLAQYSVSVGKAKLKALDLAEKIARNTRYANQAIIHAIPRVFDQSKDTALYSEAMIAAVVQSGPETADRLRSLLRN